MNIRLGTAPVSWGYCDVPGWGASPDRELTFSNITALGISGIELGSTGLLSPDAATTRAVTADHGLTPIGRFLPVVLHVPDHDPTPELDAEIDWLVEAGAEHVLIAPAWRPGDPAQDDGLDAQQWDLLCRNLDRLCTRATAAGLVPSLHPHAGMVVFSPAEVERVLEGSGIALCLDTGHAVLGGADPVDLARRHLDRVSHVHLKNLHPAIATEMSNGSTDYVSAVRAGLMVPLADTGAVDVSGVLAELVQGEYSGWVVIEHEFMLSADEPDLARITNEQNVAYTRELLYAS